MNNDIKYSMTSLMVLMTLKAQALGLGELVIESDLGEPLSATIPVIQSRGEFLPADELRISIKADQDILRQGINSFLAKEKIKLKLEETINDDVVIKLTSSSPMNEPIMNFMLELKWSSGQLIREYNVLLDPPGISVNTPVVATQASSKTTSKNTVEDFVPRSPKPATFKSPTPYKNRVYGPVQRGETLSEIAQRVRPGGFGIQLDDMIQVLVNNNPAAFINNDANLLLQGSMLSVPRGEEILAQLGNSTIATVATNTLQLQTELQTVTAEIIEQPSNTNPTLQGLTLTTNIDMSRVVNLNFDPVIETAEIEATEIEATEIETVEPVASEIVSDVVSTSPVEAIEEQIEEITVVDNTIQSDIESIREELEALESTDNNTITPVETSPLKTTADNSKNPLYLILSILGAILSLAMVVLWWMIRQKRNDASRDYQPIPNVGRQATPAKNKPVTTTQAAETTIEKAPEANIIERTTAETTQVTESEQEQYIDTIVMSPEEFKTAGVDKNSQPDEEVLSDNEIDYIGSIEDETLIKDYLEAITPVEEDTKGENLEESVTEEAIEYAKSETEVVMDISVPLDHEDDEVNDIISSLMEAEEDNSHIIDYEPETPITAEDDADDNLDIDSYVQNESETTSQVPLNVDNPEQDDDEVIDLEPDIAEYDLDELVINFQSTSPEKEFEKEVSVFMAYGDFQGAEELIEKALADDAENAVYQMALLSLYKVTGKYGAALELAASLSNKAESLSEENRKKLDLLLEDLKGDSDSASLAS